MQNYLMQNRLKPGYMGIFTTVAWNVATSKGGLGFIFIDSNANVCCVGSYPSCIEGKMEMEMRALNLTLLQFKDSREKCSNIYISFDELWKVLHLSEDLVQWRQKYFG